MADYRHILQGNSQVRARLGPAPGTASLAEKEPARIPGQMGGEPKRRRREWRAEPGRIDYNYAQQHYMNASFIVDKLLEGDYARHLASKGLVRAQIKKSIKSSL